MTLEFWLTSLIVVLLPGTGVLYTLAFGLHRGWRASVWAALGCTLGIVPHIAASIAGLAALVHASAEVFQIVKFLGAAYLLVMAWGVLRDRGALQISSSGAATGWPRIVVNGFMLNILNPKLSLFFLAFLPQFVPPGTANSLGILLLLAGVFMAETFVVFVIYGAFAAAARRHVLSRPMVLTWLRRGFAAAFGALGLRLALT